MSPAESQTSTSPRIHLLGWVLSLTVLPVANALLCRAAKGLPIFMDSIFTVLSAALFGPFQGVLVAVLTNGWIEAMNGFGGKDLPFALCGVATALIVAAWTRKARLLPRAGEPDRTRFHLEASLCILAVTAANAVLGAIIATFVYGGRTGARIDTIASGFALIADSVFSAAFLARIPANLIDKAIAVSVGVGASNWLLSRFPRLHAARRVGPGA